MRVTIERSAFLRALNHVQSVVERRNTIPILSNVLLQADGATLKLTATDLDIEIVESVPAMIAKAGAATVPAHMLYDIVRKLPDGAQLELDQSGDSNRMAIFAGRSRFNLQALPPEDFPDISAGDFSNRFSLPAGDAEGPHREDPLRDLHRGNPLLSERHLLSRSRRGQPAACGGDRWPPPGPGPDRTARRGQGHARRDRAAEDRAGSGEAPRRCRGGCRGLALGLPRSVSLPEIWC